MHLLVESIGERLKQEQRNKFLALKIKFDIIKYMKARYQKKQFFFFNSQVLRVGFSD